MQTIRVVLIVVVFMVVGALAYNYWSGNGWTLQPSAGAPGFNANAAREQGTELARKTAEQTGQLATKVEAAVSESTLTAKIKSKMALDDYVKARTINVTTNGSVVTLTGTVDSTDERVRAERLAKETAGVTDVVDRLEVGKS